MVRVRIWFKAAPTINGRLQIQQSTIEARGRNRRRQITDQRRTGAPFGEHAFGRIIGSVEVVIGQIANQPIRPALRGHAGLLAGHEFQRTMRSEMQHRIRGEILLDPLIEGAEGVGWCEALFE